MGELGVFCSVFFSAEGDISFTKRLFFGIIFSSVVEVKLGF